MEYDFQTAIKHLLEKIYFVEEVDREENFGGFFYKDVVNAVDFLLKHIPSFFMGKNEKSKLSLLCILNERCRKYTSTVIDIIEETIELGISIAYSYKNDTKMYNALFEIENLRSTLDKIYTQENLEYLAIYIPFDLYESKVFEKLSRN